MRRNGQYPARSWFPMHSFRNILNKSQCRSTRRSNYKWLRGFVRGYILEVFRISILNPRISGYPFFSKIRNPRIFGYPFFPKFEIRGFSDIRFSQIRNPRIFGYPFFPEFEIRGFGYLKSAKNPSNFQRILSDFPVFFNPILFRFDH